MPNHCFNRLETDNTNIRDNKNIAFHLVSMLGLQNLYIFFRHVVTNLINTYYMNTAVRCINLHQWPLEAGYLFYPRIHREWTEIFMHS
jgi:hypothetical protein